MAVLIKGAIGGLDEAGFLANDVVIDAVSYRVLHVGEKASRFSPALKARHPDIPWERVIGMRNLLAHNYEVVVPERIWDAATRRVPGLAKVCRAELAPQGDCAHITQ